MATRGMEHLSRATEGASPESVEAAARLFEVMRRREIAEGLSARILMWIAESMEGMDRDELVRAVAASSGQEAVLPLMERLVLREADGRPLLRARLRGMRRKEELLGAEGGAVGTAEVAERLGIKPQAVDRRRERGRILALPTGRSEFAFPVWQFDRRGKDGLVPRFADVLGGFSVGDPWMRAEFMLSAEPRLGGRRPLDALREGDVEKVEEAAAAYGEHGAE